MSTDCFKAPLPIESKIFAIPRNDEKTCVFFTERDGVIFVYSFFIETDQIIVMVITSEHKINCVKHVTRFTNFLKERGIVPPTIHFLKNDVDGVVSEDPFTWIYEVDSIPRLEISDLMFEFFEKNKLLNFLD